MNSAHNDEDFATFRPMMYPIAKIREAELQAPLDPTS